MQPVFHLSRWYVAIIVLSAGWNSSHAQQPQSPAAESFAQHFQPIVFKNCNGCHTFGGHAGGLRLDSYASLLKGGDHGPGIVRGDPQTSLVMKAVRHENFDQMPPAKKLSDTNITAIELWIKDVAHESTVAPAAGASDDYGITVANNPVHIHDFQATLLNQLGLDHTKLTFRHAGRDYRLTDVSGHVVKELVS